MAVEKFFDAVVYLAGTGTPPTTGGTQLPHVHSVSLNRSSDMLDISEMGVTTKINMAGLNEWSLEVECLNDFAGSAQVDAILNSLYGVASFNIAVRRSSGAMGSANPVFYGSAVLESYNPVDGSVGEAITVTASFQCAGNLTRTTA